MHAPDGAGGAFCVVCGRFDREMVQRRSGLKCVSCVGRRSNKGYVELQHQQATYMLSLNMPRGASNGSPLGSPFGSMNAKQSGGGSNNSRMAQTHAAGGGGRRGSFDLLGNTMGSPMNGSLRGSSPQPQQQMNLNFDMDDLIITVDDAVTQNVECERSVLNATITTNETATTYLFRTSDRSSGVELATKRHRFKEAVRVFDALKLIGGTSLPEVPEKKIFSRFEPKFIEERRQHMERFVNAAGANHFLVRHPQFLGFLGMEALVREQQRVAGEAKANERNALLGGTMMGSADFTLGGNGGGELPPEELSKCRLGTLLGKGAFGSVFLGLLHSSSTLVAVKVVQVGKDVDNGKIMQLHQELELLRNLNHPNIVKFHGALWAEQKKELSIYTEYIECGSIANMIRKFGSLPLSVIQRYLYQTLRGLQYLHGMNILHRDIKGDNLLVTKMGQVKLADFGCSGPLEEVHPASELTGTPLWMAPEAMRGDPPAMANDIWSVGCVGIEMLQRKIWNIDEKENVYTAMFKIQKAGTMPTGLPAADECNPAFHDFLTKCLALDPLERPSCKELMEHPFFAEDFTEGDDGSSSAGNGSPTVGPLQHRDQSSPRNGGDEDLLGALISPRPREAHSPPVSPRPGLL